MSTQEIYIRGINDTEARGPFTLEQLVSLGETGGIDGETLYYDTTTEQWATFSSSEEMMNLVFPPKKKLSVKPKENVRTTGAEKEEQAPITIEQMLAAAEGRTEDTEDKRAQIVAQEVSAKIGLYSGTAILLVSAAALLVPHADIIAQLDYAKVLKEPLVLLGAVDLFCAIMLGLGVAAAYPFIRFRAALGVGFLGLLFWLQGQPGLACAAIAGSVGMYFCTVFLSYLPVITAAVLGLAGMGFMAWRLLT